MLAFSFLFFLLLFLVSLISFILFVLLIFFVLFFFFVLASSSVFRTVIITFESRVLKLLFTDLVNSTKLIDVLARNIAVTDVSLLAET